MKCHILCTFFGTFQAFHGKCENLHAGKPPFKGCKLEWSKASLLSMHCYINCVLLFSRFCDSYSYRIISDQVWLWLCRDVGMKKVPVWVNYPYTTALLNWWLWMAQRFLFIFYNSMVRTIVLAASWSSCLLFSYSSYGILFSYCY